MDDLSKNSGDLDDDQRDYWNGGGDDRPSRLSVPSLVEDLSCPICMSLLRDPFVTACGHTFCCTCLTTHLNARNTCPSCATYLIKDNTFPNFILSKVKLCQAFYCPCRTSV